MKQFGSLIETSRVETTGVDATEHSPMRERVGRCLFWALVVALLCARAVYLPASHQVATGSFHQAKTEAAR
jgi:hypothetical protein